MVSKPTKRIWVGHEELGRIIRGRNTRARKMGGGEVRGVTGVGECLFVSTDRGVLEARECVERKVGGMLLCRVL